MKTKRKLQNRLLPVLIAITLILAALPMFKAHAETLPPSSGRVYRGIDVSYYQGDIDFERVKNSGIEMVYIRSSSGSDFLDPEFEANYEKARAAGLLIGVYHSLTAESEEEAEAQARFFIDCIQGKTIDCRLAMDYNYPDGMTNDELNQNALTFLNTLISGYGQEVLIYSSTYGARDVWSDKIADLVPLWVAEYGVNEPKPNGKWDSYAGFQYSETGRIDGINGDVDLDTFTEAMLKSDSKPDDGEHNEPETPDTRLIVITIVRGDTLSRLARKYGTTVQELVHMNAIRNPNLIFAGEKLYVRTAYWQDEIQVQTYTVVRGDTLWRIARRFGTTVARLASVNGIKNPDLIFPGDVLRLS